LDRCGFIDLCDRNHSAQAVFKAAVFSISGIIVLLMIVAGGAQ
jgi:hypothetical protein